VWVSAPQVNLRDRLAALYAHVGIVRSGERLEVLERQKRFLRVRTAAGQEGWIEQRYVVGADVYQGFQKLGSEAATAPVQGRAIARNTVNVHLTPARDSEHLYQIKEGDKLDLIKRGTGEKPGTAVLPVKPKAAKGAHRGKAAAAAAATDDEAPKPALEDWWLVRDHERHAGWVLARMLDLDVPLDIAVYAEGQRIVGAFALNQVYDPAYEPPKDESAGASVTPSQPQSSAPPTPPAADPHRINQYVVALSEPKDGLPFDYNQVRVFTWNLRRHRYETAYREHLIGQLPITVGEEDFGKEGRLPTFTLRAQAEDGQMVERKYKMNGPMVRRVLAAGEPGPKLAHPERPAHKARKGRRGR